MKNFAGLEIDRRLFLALLAAPAAFGAESSSDWPRLVKDGSTEITIYQPQPDSLDGITLQSRVAVSIQRDTDQAPPFGALWVIATLDVDRDADLAYVRSIKIDRTRFTDVPDTDVQSVVSVLESSVPRWNLSLSLSHLRASLQAADAPAADYRNEPPKVIVSNTPAILLLLDGQPRLQDAGTSGLKRVANTALPVVFDPRSQQYWLFGSSVWFRTDDLLRGNWTASDDAPSDVAALVKDDSTADADQNNSSKAASAAQLRSARIIVATEPTELLVTDGAPQYGPLAGGDVLYVTNSDSDILVEVATQRTFILLSGRWFAAPSLRGPWSYVAPNALPKTFANIPENSTKANMLASVPGTDRAKDAVMDSVIPQTAQVSRQDARIDVEYDGNPQFKDIPNTALAYAENTPSQVIRAGDKFYVCESGVWYLSSSANGPWAVSDTRPAGIEAVPPSSPVYNTKYVYIYDSTPDVVYVGYLPGYRWSFPYGGVVYYGTGYRYPGWYGRIYYPRPATWGFSVRYNSWSGWSFGMSWSSGWFGLSARWGSGWAGWGNPYHVGYRAGFWAGYHAGGWFGPGGYRPYRAPGWRPPYRPVGPYPRGGNNLYNRPGYAGIRPRPNMPPPMRSRQPNSVFTDRDGNLHRNNGAGWESRENRSWTPERTPNSGNRESRPEFNRPEPSRTEPRSGGSMEHERQTRMGMPSGGSRGGRRR